MVSTGFLHPYIRSRLPKRFRGAEMPAAVLPQVGGRRPTASCKAKEIADDSAAAKAEQGSDTRQQSRKSGDRGVPGAGGGHEVRRDDRPQAGPHEADSPKVGGRALHQPHQAVHPAPRGGRVMFHIMFRHRRTSRRLRAGARGPARPRAPSDSTSAHQHIVWTSRVMHALKP